MATKQDDDRYPMMKPHVGANYLRGGNKSLLLIGESHYLPVCSTQHLTAESWYSRDHTTLCGKEQKWISTSQIIQDSRRDGFKDKAHSIYRNAFKEINLYGPKYADYKDVADDVVFYNYFRRPAICGKSLNVNQKDVEVANDFFHATYSQCRPATVIFLSALAYCNCKTRLSIDVPVVVTPHPGCAHWNRVAKRYGNKKGRDILAEIVQGLWS